jgi:hypothetical protein
MAIRDYLENRGLDGGSAALQYGGCVLAAGAIAAAPIDVPVLVGSGVVMAAGVGASYALVPLRGRVNRGRSERARREALRVRMNQRGYARKH